MEAVLDRTIHAPGLPLPAAPSRPVEVDERAARRSLRDQIARLERQLGAALTSAPPGLALDLAVPAHGGARLLVLGELESLRDAMAQRLHEARAVLAARAEAHSRNRALVERMMLEPRRYKFVRVSREDLGESGCGGWEVRPRLGLIGMLAGWWQVKLSSGCPLATGISASRGLLPSPPTRALGPPRAARAHPERAGHSRARGGSHPVPVRLPRRPAAGFVAEPGWTTSTSRWSEPASPAARRRDCSPSRARAWR
jgi:hypothetical protein